MTDPFIELIPGRRAVCSGAAVTLDVLVRITPPQPEVHFPRPSLNLALVLDRSGSMAMGKKMPFAREASSFAVQQLLATDRVSVTTFDDRVEVIVPGTLATDKPDVVRRIARVQPRGSTDLHGGWAEGARQAEAGLGTGTEGLNRVLLLSDGLANSGVTDPNTIATEVRGLAARGISTTTLGVGDDYNEDLLEAMARAGDGHYYYIESPVQLADIFQTELQGLMATVGQKVSLGLEPAAGVVVSDVLNDFDKAPTGRLMLPNLIVGMPLLVLVRLNVPAQAASRSVSAPLLGLRLAWDDPQGRGRRVLQVRLDGLPVLPQAEWSARPVDPDVREQEALLMIARAQKEASRAHEQGDVAGSALWLVNARSYTASLPTSATIADELSALGEIEAALAAGDDLKMRKMSKYRSYQRQSSSSPPPPTQVDPPSKKPGAT